LREHWNKRNLSHDVHERLKADKDPSYLEWIKSNQNWNLRFPAFCSL